MENRRPNLTAAKDFAQPLAGSLESRGAPIVVLNFFSAITVFTALAVWIAIGEGHSRDEWLTILCAAVVLAVCIGGLVTAATTSTKHLTMKVLGMHSAEPIHHTWPEAFTSTLLTLTCGVVLLGEEYHGQTVVPHLLPEYELARLSNAVLITLFGLVVICVIFWLAGIASMVNKEVTSLEDHETEVFDAGAQAGSMWKWVGWGIWICVVVAFIFAMEHVIHERETRFGELLSGLNLGGLVFTVFIGTAFLIRPLHYALLEGYQRAGRAHEKRYTRFGAEAFDQRKVPDWLTFMTYLTGLGFIFIAALRVGMWEPALFVNVTGVLDSIPLKAAWLIIAPIVFMLFLRGARHQRWSKKWESVIESARAEEIKHNIRDR